MAKVLKQQGKVLIYNNKAFSEKSQEKTITPSTNAQVVTPDEGYTCLSKVNVEAVTSAIDSNITAENIKKDISILGVVGTLESGGSGEDLQSVIDGIIDRTLTSIESSVTSIGDYALNQCLSLTSASFPNVTSIGYYAFNQCSKLSSIEIPNATSIGDHAFDYCSKLSSIEIPNVETIGTYAFSNCRFSSIRLPKVKTINSRAFQHVSACKLYDFRGATEVPTLNNYDAFYGTSSSKKIVVPDDLYDTWITSTNWSEYSIKKYIIKASDYEASL